VDVSRLLDLKKEEEINRKEMDEAFSSMNKG